MENNVNKILDYVIDNLVNITLTQDTDMDPEHPLYLGVEGGGYNKILLYEMGYEMDWAGVSISHPNSVLIPYEEDIPTLPELVDIVEDYFISNNLPMPLTYRFSFVKSIDLNEEDLGLTF
jgi:hypothetical protein